MHHIAKAAQQYVLAAYGLAKTAAPILTPEQLQKMRELYRRQGAMAGALRGGLVGGAIGLGTSEEGERLQNTLKGLGIGTALGGFAGGLHGHHMTSNPEFAPFVRRTVTDPDNRSFYSDLVVKRPGQFHDEIIKRVHLPGDRWHDTVKSVEVPPSSFALQAASLMRPAS